MLEAVLTLDADLTVAGATAVLHDVPPGRTVVIRRRHPDGSATVLWYVLAGDEIRRLLAHADPRMPLGRALDLHEHGAQQVREASHPEVRARTWTGLVVNGGQALGLTQRGASPTRGPGTHERPLPTPGGDPPGPGHVEVAAYPRVDVPAQVDPGATFDVVIGVSGTAQQGLREAPMLLRMPSPTLEVTITVIADGFLAPAGIRRSLTVDRDALDAATVSVSLVAPTPAQSPWRGRVEVEYAVAGTLVGRAWRDVVVAAGAPATPVTSTDGGGQPFAVTADSPADLTVSISAGAQPGRLVWTFTTPHPVPLPDVQVTTDLPVASAQAFALGKVKEVAAADGTPAAEPRVTGIARAVATAYPVVFWQVLTDVWRLTRAAGHPPSVLVVSAEPYVPWELASTEPTWVVDRTLVDQAAPQVLGAQVRLGRWLPAGPDTPAGVRRPPVAPATEITVEDMAVVVGDYKSESGLRPLPEAFDEGRHLSDTYRATWVKGTLAEVTDLLGGQLTERGSRVTPEVIHMACHGEIDPANPMLNGIVLSDTALRVDALLVLGGELGDGAPLVFLNACQLGLTDSDILGDQGGLAAAFLAVGARAFLAPLWSVADDLAREIAEQFYRLTLDEQVPVGEALRQVRGRFLTIPGHTQTTPLAYAFYGHPALTLRRTG